MANTKKYLSHLLQNTGITPACSEEERAAADAIAKIFENHGFTPEIQEFSASGMKRVTQAILGIVVFIGSVFVGIGGAVGVMGLLLTLAGAVLFVLERTGRPVISNLGSGGLSQNVIAYHKASGPLASPRNRPVVVVAHYDSPREDLLCREPFAAYRPLMVKLLPFAMVAPAVMSVIRLFPVPDSAKIVLWLIIVLVALIPLANGIAIIANRFVLPYTSGSVSNKSSVAAMLGVMDAVSPYELGEEFPRDMPADEYFAEQQRMLEEAIAEAEAAAAAEAEAATAYPHEQGEQGASELFDGADDAEAEGADFNADMSDGVDAPVNQGPVSGLEVIDGTATDMSVVDLGSTSMLSTDDLQADSTVSVDAAELGVADDIDASGGAESDMDADATIAGIPLPAEQMGEGDDDGRDEEPPVESCNGEADADSIAPGVQSELDLDAAESEPKPPYCVNAAGNVRFGSAVIRSLGMLPSTCSVIYEPSAETEAERPTAFEASHAIEDEVQDASSLESDVLDESEELDSYEPVVDSFDVVDDYESIDDDSRIGHEDEFGFEDDDEGDVYEGEEGFTGIIEAEYEVIDDEPSDYDGDDVAPLDARIAPSDSNAPLGPDEPTASDEPSEKSMAESVSLEQADDPSGEESSDEVVELGSTAIFDPAGELGVDGSGAEVDLSGTVAMPAQPVETVDSLMAQINGKAPLHPRQRDISVPSTADAPTPRIPQTANRASLFDLPDPSSRPIDPFATSDFSSSGTSEGFARGNRDDSQDVAAIEARNAFEVISSPATPVAQAEDPFETISAPGSMSAPASSQEKPRRGLSRFFGRKKKGDDSMSEWLGVDDSFDAKSSGSDIGSWDNFDDDWKGGAAGFEGATEEELREAVADMGDDELLGHDIWFVATGASENGNAGIRAFLDAHRDKLRGVFLINLESVGAGQLAMLASEGEERVLKGDKRIMKLVQQVSADFHRECAVVEMPYATTDAHVAMSMSLRSLTIGGIEGSGFALSHTEQDQPYNVDTENVAFVSDVVTEVIRRS